MELNSETGHQKKEVGWPGFAVSSTRRLPRFSFIGSSGGCRYR